MPDSGVSIQQPSHPPTITTMGNPDLSRVRMMEDFAQKVRELSSTPPSTPPVATASHPAVAPSPSRPALLALPVNSTPVPVTPSRSFGPPSIKREISVLEEIPDIVEEPDNIKDNVEDDGSEFELSKPAILVQQEEEIEQSETSSAVVSSSSSRLRKRKIEQVNSINQEDEEARKKMSVLMARVAAANRDPKRRRFFIEHHLKSLAKAREYHLENTKSKDLQSFFSGDSRVKYKRLSMSDFTSVCDVIDHFYFEDEEPDFAQFLRIEFDILNENYGMMQRSDGILKISLPNETHRAVARRITKEIFAKITNPRMHQRLIKHGQPRKPPRGDFYVVDKRQKNKSELFLDRGFWVKDSMYNFFIIPDGAIQQRGSHRPAVIIDVLTNPTSACIFERAATYILGSDNAVGFCIIVSLFNYASSDPQFIEKGRYTHASVSAFEINRAERFSIMPICRDIPVFPDASEATKVLKPIPISCEHLVNKELGGQHPAGVELEWNELRDWIAVAFEETCQPKKGEHFYS